MHSIAIGFRVIMRSAGPPAKRTMQFLVTVSAVAALAAPLQSQQTARFDSGIVIGGDWLQANKLPLDRDALQSGEVTLSFRRHRWTVDASPRRWR